MTDDVPTEAEVGADTAWQLLLEELDDATETLASEGWETLSIVAGDAGGVVPEDRFTDRHGYAYVVPGEEADRFGELFVPDGFPATEVFRRSAAGRLFVLSIFRDPPTERAVLLAGTLDRSGLEPVRSIARETGTMYTHLFRVDGTHLGSFRHDDPEPFFPGGTGTGSPVRSE